MTDTKCTTCGWPFPRLCVCPNGDRHWDKLVSADEKAQLERIREQVAKVWGPRSMCVSFFPYEHMGEPGPVVYVGFSSHDRIKLAGHPRVLDALERLLEVYVEHGPFDTWGRM